MRTRIIMAAAEEIVFRGFKFTMGDLTKRLSISKSSLYEHFSSKGELISTIISMAIIDIREQQEEIYNDSGLSFEEKFQALMTVSPKLFGPINDGIYNDLRKDYPDDWNKVVAFREERLDRMTSLLEQGIKAAAIRPVSFPVLRQLIIGAMNDLFDYRFLARNNMTYADAIAATAGLLVYGMSLSCSNGGRIAYGDIVEGVGEKPILG